MHTYTATDLGSCRAVVLCSQAVVLYSQAEGQKGVGGRSHAQQAAGQQECMEGIPLWEPPEEGPYTCLLDRWVPSEAPQEADP